MPRGKSNKVLEPYIMAIATIYLGNKQIGFRICDINDKSKKPMDVSLASCITQLSSNPDLIKNIRLIPDGFKLINGSLANITKIDTNGNVIETFIYNGEKYKKTPLMIVNQIENIGYTVVDYQGKIRKLPNDKIIMEAKVMGLANGAIKYIAEENKEYIVGLEEPYIVTHVSKSKTGGANIPLNLGLSVSKDTKAIANSAKVNTENELDYQDAFRAISKEQKKVIQDYYMWYTVDKFNELTHNLRLTVKPSKALKLTELRGDQKWEMGGMKDTGAAGFGRCTLGHPLRYEYYAVVWDENKPRELEYASDVIVFGETCSGDFFDISVEDMRKLIKVRKKMSEEIEIMTYIQSNNLNEEAWKKNSILVDCIKRLGQDKCTKIFGVKIAKTLYNFLSVNMPFPESLIKQARKAAYRNEEIKTGTANLFWKLVIPSEASNVDYIYKNKDYTQILKTAYEYLEFMCYNRLDGTYAYDPINKTGKGEGGFNAKTRQERSILLMHFSRLIRCNSFSLNELEHLLKTIGIMISISDKLKNYYTDCSNSREIFDKLFIVMTQIETKYNKNESEELKNLYVEAELLASSLGVTKRPEYNSGMKILGCMKFKSGYNRDSKLAISNIYSIEDVYNLYIKYASNIKLFEYLKNEERAEYTKRMKLEEQRRIEEAERIKKEREDNLLVLSGSLSKYLENTKQLREKIYLEDKKSYNIIAISNVKRENRDLRDIGIVVYEGKDRTRLLISYYPEADNIKKVQRYSLDNYRNLNIANLLEDTTEYSIVNFILKTEAINNEIYNKFILGDQDIQELVTSTIDSLYEQNLLNYDRMKRLNRLIEDNKDKELDNDYYVTICKDIIKRNIKYENLTYKQKYIVESTIKKLSNKEVKNEQPKESEKSSLSEELLKDIKDILSKCNEDNNLKSDIEKLDGIGLSIMRTVTNTGRVSIKQKKHIDKVIDYYKTR